MRALIVLLITAASPASPSSDCVCGTDSWANWQYEPVFAEDPFVEPGAPYVTGVEEMNIGIAPDGDCVIHNTFPDAPAEAPTYFDEHSQMEVVKIRFTRMDGSVTFITIEEMEQAAYTICFGNASS